DVAAVAGGQEVVRAAAAHVEAERAAVLPAVDGVPAGGGGAERARDVLDADRVPEPLRGRLDRRQGGPGDRTVDGQDDLVGRRVRHDWHQLRSILPAGPGDIQQSIWVISPSTYMCRPAGIVPAWRPRFTWRRARSGCSRPACAGRGGRGSPRARRPRSRPSTP